MKIVSLAFFRNASSGYESEQCGVARGIFFVNFLRTVIRAHHAVWQGWDLVIYHDDRAMEFPYFKAMKRMEEAGILKLRDSGVSKTLCGSMLWRMRPVFWPDVDAVVCRDLDSLPMERDRKMVEKFLASPAIVHAIHDSESHSGPLMGGMIAIKPKPFLERVKVSEYNEAMDKWDLRQYGSDQRFLNAFVYPQIKDRLIIHTRRPTVADECQRIYAVEPQTTDLDKVIRHIGAPYDVDLTMRILNAMDYPHKQAIEDCEHD